MTCKNKSSKKNFDKNQNIRENHMLELTLCKEITN